MSNFFKAIGHGIVTIALFTIPVVLQSHSAILDLTVGGVLTAIYHLVLSRFATSAVATA